MFSYKSEVSLFHGSFGILYSLLERKYRSLLMYRRLGYIVVRHIEVALYWCSFFDCHQRKENNVYSFHGTYPTISHK